MIDLNSKRKEFEERWVSLGGSLENFSYTTDNTYSLSKHGSTVLDDVGKFVALSVINQAWVYWLDFSRQYDHKIKDLKQSRVDHINLNRVNDGTYQEDAGCENDVHEN